MGDQIQELRKLGFKPMAHLTIPHWLACWSDTWLPIVFERIKFLLLSEILYVAEKNYEHHARVGQLEVTENSYSMASASVSKEM